MPNFTVHPHGDYKASGIDFNAVYYNRHDPPTNSNLVASYNYFRFWPDGRVIVRALDHLPTKTDVEDFTRGYIGYYLITNRTIVTEVFIPNTATFRWDYCRGYAVLTNDEIVELRQEMGRQTLETNDRYRNLSFGELVRQPDW
jgi:hypothetical protein